MIKAVFYRLKNGDIKGFDINGHAGAAKKGEYDMICAAVSAVGYTTLGGLDELCGINTYKESNGSLVMELPADADPAVWTQAQTILKTMVIGLKQIENQYHQHIKVSFKEV
jgi:uncharacterized protein YsxB (DUF464 family)